MIYTNFLDNKRVLIIAAHPDDEVLGCGGLIAQQRNRTEFSCLFLAEGISARYSKDKQESKECLGEIKYRNDCALRALSFLNILNFKFINYKCGGLNHLPIIEINHVIEESINIFKPQIVITHSNLDCNNDHRIVSRSVDMATRPTRNNSIQQLLHFEIQSSTELNYQNPFTPNLFIELSQKSLDQKIEAMQLYDREFKNDIFARSPSALEVLARFRGIQSGYKYSEAFKIVRQFEPSQ